MKILHWKMMRTTEASYLRAKQKWMDMDSCMRERQEKEAVSTMMEE
jgi:hypothetical protein